MLEFIAVSVLVLAIASFIGWRFLVNRDKRMEQMLRRVDLDFPSFPLPAPQSRPRMAVKTVVDEDPVKSAAQRNFSETVELRTQCDRELARATEMRIECSKADLDRSTLPSIDSLHLERPTNDASRGDWLVFQRKIQNAVKAMEALKTPSRPRVPSTMPAPSPDMQRDFGVEVPRERNSRSFNTMVDAFESPVDRDVGGFVATQDDEEDTEDAREAMDHSGVVERPVFGSLGSPPPLLGSSTGTDNDDSNGTSED